MNAVYDAAAARRRALEAELIAANDSQLAAQRALAASQAQITALLKERDQLDTWLAANQNSVQPGSAT
ncbi:hypothetical protein APR50_10525 [Variovorax paradoxus]|jgi:hypothetical protein|uniref:hypothetical protein n=1 Tax=Variovorax paradoxus TaxID=34073 RepID=UPI0006E5C6B6|nr:hypothetical protein APR52_20775 [Variovorax paradoxus]KPV08897.1 hypothetical protein APR50_10525 [Variovorax paradoxus]KPV11394.1 hypothetical protein APR49_09400 [Variovorax paradoxus]KPV23286.1 hypothetical protein APR51_07975 [Variovorax paradoxus]KPV31148.1 hypothetical protein APR48_17630 [Variovorax paradoxus]